MPKGPDKRKNDKIIQILKRNPRGIWIRELARQTNMPVATVSYYLNKFMKNEVEIQKAAVGGITYKQMKIVKLRDGHED